MAIRVYTSLRLNRDSAFIARPADAFRRTSKLSDFKFTPDPGMLYVTARAISSRVNANFDGWPSSELRKAWKTFIGKPVFVDHHNFDERRSRGAIIDARILEDKLASGHPDTWVELLIEVDAQQFPKLAQAILANSIDAVSMGADVQFTVCSACGNKARDVSEYCRHIPTMKGRRVMVDDKTSGKKTAVLVYEDCYGVGFFEISFVFDPADESALITDKLLVPAEDASVRTLSHLREQGESIYGYQRRVAGLAKTAARATLTTSDREDLQSSGLAICSACNGRGHIPGIAQHSPRPCGTCRTAGVVRIADQTLLALPTDAQTIREEVPCPVCGADMQLDSALGGTCQNCGTQIPPEGLGDPDTQAEGVQMDVQEQGEGAPGGDPQDEETDEEADEDDDQENRRKTEGGKIVSRVEEMRREAQRRQADGSPYGTHDVGTSYDQTDQVPSNSVTPYGTSVPGGGPVPPAEPPVATTMGERAPEAMEDVQNLDASTVVAPQGQSQVSVAKAALNKRADRLEAQAKALRRQAETVVRDDVENLDAPTPVNVQPEAVVDVTRPTAQPDQLALADTPDIINDGRETGVGTPQDRGTPVSPFTDNGVYAPPNPAIPRGARKDDRDEAIAKAVAAARRDTGARVLRIANLVDERIELGLTKPDEKIAEIARFEGIDDGQLEGYIAATKEVKAAQVRVAGSRIRVASGTGHPELSGAPKREPEVADDPAVLDGIYNL